MPLYILSRRGTGNPDRFVTLFASQTPVPALLHLWRLMLEYGDPVLHQFFTLAWLVSNRVVLVETSPDDMPATVSGLRLRSAGVVDGVFRAAVALRESTPRLFCDVLRRACFAEDQEGSGGGSCEGRGPRGPTAGGGEQSEPRAGWADLRVSLLEGLRAEGVLSVDADQVAEILRARPSSTTATPGTTTAAPTSPATGDDSWRSGSGRIGGRYVLVDCRPPAPGREGPAGGTRAGGEAAGDGRVIWRRIHPAESFGREAAAVAHVLREVGAGGDARHDERTSATCHKEAVEGAAPVHDVVGASVVAGSSSSVVAAPYGSVGGGAAGNELVHSTRIGGGHAVSGGGGNGIGEVKHPVGTCTTHVCFVGCGGRGGGGGDGGGRLASSTTAAGEAATAPEFRLAREAASRSCLTARVCVLQGGFPALDEALLLSRRRSSEHGRGFPEAGVPNRSVAVAECPPFGAAGTDASVEASADSSAEEGGTGAGQSCGAGGGGGETRADGDPETSVSTTTSAAGGGSPPSPASPAGGTGGGTPTPPPQIPPFSQGLERKASRLAGNSRISEPFRVYAARSADETGRALRSLPLTASKPLEVRLPRFFAMIFSVRCCRARERFRPPLLCCLGDVRSSLDRASSDA